MASAANFTTYQLRILAHLLRSRSVTSTAAHFETSQPAVSRLLAEMRQRFDDPLLVRSGDRMSVTDRALHILDEVEAVLARLSGLAAPVEPFDPGRFKGRCNLGFTDSDMVALAPSVVNAIRRDAGPLVETRIRSIGADFDVLHALANRDLDLIVDCVTRFTRDTYMDLRHTPLHQDDIVLLVRRGHPVAKSPPRQVEQYCDLGHVAPLPISKAEKGPIDGTLAAMKSPRRVQAYLPEYSLIPHALIGSDLVFTTSRRFARYYSRCLPLQIVAAPDFFPQLEFRMLWHEVAQRNPAVRWLRNLVLSVARDTYAKGVGNQPTARTCISKSI